MTRAKAPTMTDVAKAAGVSQTTVSLVLNAKPGQSISEPTRQRVIKACDTLGYHMNLIARAMNRSESGMIGLLADELLTENFAGAIIAGAQDMTWNNNKILMLASIVEADSGLSRRAIEYLKGFCVESIVYATKYHHQITPPDSLFELPTVLVNCYEPTNTLPCILPDDFNGAYQATKYLLANGHRNIFYISSDLTDPHTGEPIPATPLRADGFRTAMREYGVTDDLENRIAYVSIAWQGVATITRKLLQAKDRPTAILCYNDRMALSVYSAAAMLNLRIPDDLSVVGYDNQIDIAEFLYPTLTTVELPHYKLGMSAINYLEKKKFPFRYEKKLITPKLVVRHSVKRI